MVLNPVTIGADQKLAKALELMKRYDISGLPVVAADGRAVGIITNRDVRFERNLEQPVSAMMTSKLITVREGTSLEDSKELLHKNRIEKLLVIDELGKLRGLITIKDIQKAQQHPFASKDDLGRLRCGAAVGTGEDRSERVEALLNAGCDVIVVDTAHGRWPRPAPTRSRWGSAPGRSAPPAWSPAWAFRRSPPSATPRAHWKAWE